MTQIWNMHNRTTEEQARVNRGTNNNGEVLKVEDTSTPDDDWDVNIGLSGSGMVYELTKPFRRTGGVG